MKSILLASAAAFAFAGAAAAEVTFSGEAALGFNDDGAQGNDGFYWDANLAVALSQALDNGLTATASFDFDFADANIGQALEAGGFVLSLTSEAGGLFFGDTVFAAETHWSATGTMDADNFSEADGETVLRGDINYGDISASVSGVLQDAAGADAVDDIDQLSFGVSGAVGAITFGAAYQESSDGQVVIPAVSYDPATANGDFSTDEVWGVYAGTTFASATVKLAYASNETTGEDSLGVSAAYPVGPVTLSGYYVIESAGDDNSWGVRAAYADGPFAILANYEDRVGVYRWNVEGSYNTGLGLVVYGGVLNREPFDGEVYYVAGEYDLGGGASLLFSYADADDATQGYRNDDEVGAREYQIGTTVEVSFAF